MNDKQAEGNILDSATAAKLIGVTPRWLRQLSANGWIESAGKNRWSLVKVVQGYVAFLQSEERNSTKAAAASRVTDARTREIELRTAAKEREMIPSTDVAALGYHLCSQLLDSVLLTPKLIAKPGPERQRIEAIVQQEHDRLKERFQTSIQKVLPPDALKTKDYSEWQL